MIDTARIGNEFYNLMMELGEDYILETHDDDEYIGKISLKAKTSSTYMLAEREYLMIGTMTFPDVEAQKTFRGCYLKRTIDPNRYYVLVSTIPEPTEPRVADVYVMECNETVDLAYLKKEKDEKFNDVTVPIVFEEGVKVYFDSTVQKQRRSSDGNFDQTLYYMQMPAHYGLSQDQVVLRKMFKWDAKKKKNVLTTTRFRVESVDLSLVTKDEDGNVYGICDVQMSLDTRA